MPKRDRRLPNRFVKTGRELSQMGDFADRLHFQEIADFPEVPFPSNRRQPAHLFEMLVVGEEKFTMVFRRVLFHAPSMPGSTPGHSTPKACLLKANNYVEFDPEKNPGPTQRSPLNST